MLWCFHQGSYRPLSTGLCLDQQTSKRLVKRLCRLLYWTAVYNKHGDDKLSRMPFAKMAFIIVVFILQKYPISVPLNLSAMAWTIKGVLENSWHVTANISRHVPPFSSARAHCIQNTWPLRHPLQLDGRFAKFVFFYFFVSFCLKAVCVHDFHKTQQPSSGVCLCSHASAIVLWEWNEMSYTVKHVYTHRSKGQSLVLIHMWLFDCIRFASFPWHVWQIKLCNTFSILENEISHSHTIYEKLSIRHII